MTGGFGRSSSHAGRRSLRDCLKRTLCILWDGSGVLNISGFVGIRLAG